MNRKIAAKDQLTDGLIILRQITPADAEQHLAGEDEPTVQFLSGGRSTMKSVLAWAEFCQQSWDSSGPKKAFGISLLDANELIGAVDFDIAAPGIRAGVANISYGLYPDARGNGYATRAVSLVMRYLVSQTRVAIAVIRVDRENINSQRIPERLDFNYLGLGKTPESVNLMTYAKALRGSNELELSDVCS